MEKKNLQHLNVTKSFKAFAFLYGTRFVLIQLNNIYTKLKLYDNFSYVQNDSNMPFEGKLKNDFINVVNVYADENDNYFLETLCCFKVVHLNKHIGNGQIKNVLREIFCKYFKLKLNTYKRNLEYLYTIIDTIRW